jgi:hypothetical protein
MPLTLKLPFSLALIIFTRRRAGGARAATFNPHRLSATREERERELGRKIYFEFVLHTNWKLDCVYTSAHTRE